MANNVFSFNKLTGGTAGCLDDLDHNNISDGDLAFGAEITADANKCYIYRFKDPDATVESSPDVIEPDSGGTGCWKLLASQNANWDDMRTFLAATTLSEALAALSLQYDHIWIPATAMTPTTTSGGEQTSSEEWDDATNDNMRNYIAFDTGADEYACFDLVMPSAWDRSTIKFKPYWTGGTGCSSGETGCFALQGAAVGDNEDLDTNQGTAQTSTDTLQDDDNDKLHIGPASAAITIANSPALGDKIHFKIYRDVSGDNAAGDILLFGIVMEIKYTNEVSAW